MSYLSVNRFIWLFAGMVILSGCSTTKYACGVPGGVGCKSVKEVYDLSNSGKLKITKALPTDDDDEGDGDNKQSEDPDPVSFNQQDLMSKKQDKSYPFEMKPGQYLRSKEVKLRIWITPWEDAEKDLHDQQYVYTIVQDPKWLLKENRKSLEQSISSVSKAE